MHAPAKSEKGETKMRTAEISLSPRASVAMAVLAALEREKQSARPQEIEDISRFLFDLYQAGIDIGDVALRRVPAGFYSKDVEILIGHYLSSGYAQKMSPVCFTEEGQKLLRETIEEEKASNSEAIRRAAQVLGLPDLGQD